jgi:PKD domain/PASTA domain
MKRVVVACAVAALLVPSAAAATLPWLAPVDLTPTGQSASLGQVAMDAAGDTYVVWRRSNGTNTIVQARVRPAGGAWLPTIDLSAPGQDASEPIVAVDPAGNATAVWTRASVVQSSYRPAGGAWGSPVDLSGMGVTAFDPQLAVNPAGTAVAVWGRTTGTGQALQTASRASGGAWAPGVDLSAPGGIGSRYSDVTFDRFGNAVATWVTGAGTVQAAYRPLGGAWGDAKDLSQLLTGGAFDPVPAFDRFGNATVVWSGFNSGSSYLVQTATRPVASAEWLPPQDLSLPGEAGQGAVIAIAPNGTAIAMWNRIPAPAMSVIQYATRPRGGLWGLPKDLTSPTGRSYGPSLGIDDTSNAVATWTEVASPSDTHVTGARRNAAGVWGPAQDVSSPATNNPFPQVGVDGAGNAVAVWGRSNGSNTILQSSTRDGAGPVFTRLRVPVGARPGTRLTFGVASSDLWSALAGAPRWRFGDGSSARGRTVRHRYHRNGAFRLVLTQSDSLGNTTTVRRTMHIGPPCRVPAVVGKTLAQAKRAIRAAHCLPGVVTHAASGRVAAGHVISQRPRVGRQGPNGTPVALVVSRGP